MITHPEPLLKSPRAAFTILAGYFLAHLLLRWLVSPSLQMDEAEQALVTQEWLWGYGSQPPLYTWLQIPVFAVFGVNVFALALLKNLLLFSVYIFTFLSARLVLRDTVHALVATFGLLLMVFFAWESQRDQTHLVLATALATATVYVALRLFTSPRPRWYAVLGVVAGLGTLAKYNYAVLIAALLLAAVSLPALRPLVLNRRSLLTLAGFALVLTPHVLWAVTHEDLLLSQSDKFEIVTSSNRLATAGAGVVLFLRRVCEYAAGPALVFAAVSVMARRVAAPSAHPELLGLLERTLVIGLALCLIVVLGFQVTAMRARWLQPLLISLPLVCIGRLQPRLTTRWINAGFLLGFAAMITVPLGLYARVPLSGRWGHTSNLNFPYPALAQQIRSAGFERGAILADGPLLGGNLRQWFPESRITACGNIRGPAPADRWPLLLVWRPYVTGISTGQLDFAVSGFRIDPNELRPRLLTAPALHAPQVQESLYISIIAGPARAVHSPQGAAMQ